MFGLSTLAFMSYEARIEEMGLDIPAAPAPGGNYVPAKRIGNLVYTAGAICVQKGEMTRCIECGMAFALNYLPETNKMAGDH